MTTGDKGKLFILFVLLFTLPLLSKIVCSLCVNQKKHLQNAKRPRLGTTLALQCYVGLVSSGFLCKVTQDTTTGDKVKLFILFVPLFTLSLLSKIVCSPC